LGLVIGTQERNRVWSTNENLWADTVAKNPTSGRALNNLALVYMARGDFTKALPYFEQCEHHWPSYMYCALNKGVSLYAMAKYEDAEKTLLRAYQLAPRNVHVNFHLGKYQLEVKKDFVQAAMYFKYAVDATGGRYPAADINRAIALSFMKNYAEARNCLNRALSYEPGNLGGLFQLGRIELETGNAGGAVQAYDRLLSQEPNHLLAWYNLGVAQVAISDFAGAMKAFEKTVALDPKSEQGLFNLAFVAEKLQDGPRAITAARQLAAINPAKTEYQSRVKELERKFGTKGR